MKPLTTDTYDILVVGAGPAGASAAAEAARRKCRVLMVERRRAVGLPVQCAEYIPAPLIGELELGRQFVVQPIRGLKTFLFDREVKQLLSPGYLINRDTFDQNLVAAACANGVDVLLSTKAVSRNGNAVIIKSKDKPPANVKAKIIIGADGPLSTVGRWIGSVHPNLIAAVQIRVPLKRNLEFAEVYFDREIYAGYAWLFPKNNEANLGLGMKNNNRHPPQLRQCLERFILNRVKDRKIENKPSRLISGWIPAGPASKIVHENVLLAGDAAGQTHPITGAGIFPAVSCGRLAGKWAACALEANDLNLLFQYKIEYQDLFGESMHRALNRRRLLEEEWNHLDRIFKHCWVAFREYYDEIK